MCNAVSLAELECKVGRAPNWAETPKAPRIETHVAIWQPGVLASWGGADPGPLNLPVYSVPVVEKEQGGQESFAV